MSETMTEVSRPDKPRGKCTGCAFDYQLGTARTGEHKGKQVIRKHNSRTGPGLCSGAQIPPEPTYEECEGAAGLPKNGAGHCEQGACTGCCGCSSMCTTDPCGQPFVPLTEIRLPVTRPGDVVGVAPGGTPIVVPDPFTAPAPVAEGDVSDEITLGPWVTAAFDGECDGTCGGSILEGERIRADGEGGWLCEDCGVKEPLRVETRVPDPREREATAALAAIAADDMRAAVLEYGSAAVAPDLFTAPGAASDIPESTVTVSGQPEPDRDQWGRYLIMGTAHTRATTFAKLGANTKAIEAWNERNVIRGMTLRPDLLMLANGLEVKRDRNDLNSIAAQAKDAAGSKVAANIGTAYHAFSERLDAGLISLMNVPEQYRRRVRQYVDALSRAGLTTRPEWIERTTAVRADQVSAPLPVAGTLDRIFQMPDGSLVIGDLKTGSDLSYGEMEIEVQLALYAHGVNTHGLFDWNTKQWESHTARVAGDVSLKIRTDIAVVVHLPADGDGCTLYVADIERGWRDAQRLGPLQASLKEKNRFQPLTAADLAPQPAPVGRDEVSRVMALMHPPVPETECFAGTSVPLPSDVPEAVDRKILWHRAMHLIKTAGDQAQIAELYQYAMDSGKFHQDQLAVLVGLGKDRLNALARS